MKGLYFPMLGWLQQRRLPSFHRLPLKKKQQQRQRTQLLLPRRQSLLKGLLYCLPEPAHPLSRGLLPLLRLVYSGCLGLMLVSMLGWLHNLLLLLQTEGMIFSPSSRL